VIRGGELELDEAIFGLVVLLGPETLIRFVVILGEDDNIE
jgi:hypothetical protein